jgi:hypothetical protein
MAQTGVCAAFFGLDFLRGARQNGLAGMRARTSGVRIMNSRAATDLANLKACTLSHRNRSGPGGSPRLRGAERRLRSG